MSTHSLGKSTPLPTDPAQVVFDAAEAIRWLFRHHVLVDFMVEEDGNTWLRMTVPLRSPEGGVLNLERIVRSHGAAAQNLIDLALVARTRLNLE